MASALAGNPRYLSDPFHAPVVVVPGPTMALWLKLRLCDEWRIAANIEFRYLEDELWCRTVEWSGAPAPRRFTRSMMETALLGLLAGDVAEGKDSGGVLGGIDPATRSGALRLQQLAARLTAILTDYMYQRGDDCAGWLRSDFGPRANDIAAWEAGIFERLFGPDGVAQAGNMEPLPILAARVLAADAAAAVEPRTISCFGLWTLSSFHIRLLFRLARVHTVRLYQLGFTPAVPGLCGGRAEPRPLAGAPLDTTGDGPVEQWGQVEREFLQMCVEEQARSGVDASIKWLDADAEPASAARPELLGALQHAMSGRTVPVAADADRRPVQVGGAATVRREVEAIHSAIVHMLDEDPTLQQDEIAVLVADLDTYRPHILSVFGAHSPRIAWSMLGSSAKESSAWAAGARALLELPGSEYGRQAVLGLLHNPCVQAALRVTGADVARWEEWATDLGIFGYRDAAHEERDGVAVRDVFTWSKGLRRLRLGRIMDTSCAVIAPDADVVPWANMDSATGPGVGRLSLFVESLFERAAALERMRCGGAGWAAELEDYLSAFLAVPRGMPQEAVVRDALLRDLGELAALGPTAAGGGEGHLAFAVVREFVRARTRDIPCRHGAALTGGVTVAPPAELAGIPFRVLFFAGLDAGVFPGDDTLMSLDLRSCDPKGRRPGDTSRMAKDRMLFMYALGSVRERFLATYQSHDLQKDCELYPSSVLNQLRRLVRLVGGSDDACFDAGAIAWHGHSFRYLAPPATTAAVPDLCRNASATDRCVALAIARRDGRIESGDELCRLLDVDCAEHGAPAGAAHGHAGEPETVQVQLQSLAAFLRDPAKTVLRRILAGADLEQHDNEDVEPFVLPYLGRRNLAQLAVDIFLNADEQTAVKLLEEQWKLLERQARCPVGKCGELELKELEKRVRVCAQGIRGRMNGHEGMVVRGARMGFAPGRQEAQWVAPAAQMDIGNGRTVLVSGRLSLLMPWDGDKGEWTAVVASPLTEPKADGEVPDPSLLEPFLFCLTAMASQVKPHGYAGHGWHADVSGQGFAVAMVGTNDEGEAKVVRWRWNATDDQAREFLSGILVDCLDCRDLELLPLKLLGAHAGELRDEMKCGDASASIRDMIAGWVDDDRDSYRPVWYPSAALQAAAPEVPENACEVLRRRIGLFWEGMQI